MIALLGSGGYIGSAFAKELNHRKIPWWNLDWRKVEAESFSLSSHSVSLVINCAAYIPKPSASLCEFYRSETILGNVVLPTILAAVCGEGGIPLAHISTSFLWNDGVEHSEDDPPQSGFSGHLGFYVGTKIISERVVRRFPKHYIFRVGFPFDEFDNDRNYLSKLAGFKEVWDLTNSVAHRADFAKVCLDLWQAKAPYGTYHCTNTGSVSARQILMGMLMRGIINKCPIIVENKAYDCKLSVRKALSCGVVIRSAEEALQNSLDKWNPRG